MRGVMGLFDGRLRDAQHAHRRVTDDAVAQRTMRQQREVFLLREYSGIPFKEIAEVTGT